VLQQEVFTQCVQRTNRTMGDRTTTKMNSLPRALSQLNWVRSRICWIGCRPLAHVLVLRLFFLWIAVVATAFVFRFWFSVFVFANRVRVTAYKKQQNQSSGDHRSP
jgi:hypothetical protein